MRRISIKSLMGVVVLCGIVMAAIRDTSGFWDGAVYTMTLAFLAFALLATVHAKGHSRAAWLGACVWGWLYWALAFLPGFAETLRLPLTTDRAIRNITSTTVDPTLAQANRVYSFQQLIVRESSEALSRSRRLVRNPEDPSIIHAEKSLKAAQADLERARQEILTIRPHIWLRLFPGATKPTHFARTAHSLFTLIAAGLGASASAWLHRRYGEQPDPA